MWTAASAYSGFNKFHDCVCSHLSYARRDSASESAASGVRTLPLTSVFCENQAPTVYV